MESCIYEGTVFHRRSTPVRHEFRRTLFMMWLDLGELPKVFAGRWLWAAGRPAVASFRREDHLGDRELALEEAVRRLVAERAGSRPRGPIRLLTQLRYWGYIFNPLSVYFCFDESGRSVEAIVLEVNNTPWGEQHAYVLKPGGTSEDGQLGEIEFAKAMHVSPFMEMEMDYRFAGKLPGPGLAFALENWKGGRMLHRASLQMERREITPLSLARELFKHPFMTGKIIASIYFEAFRLWLKGCPPFPHPAAGKRTEEAKSS